MDPIITTSALVAAIAAGAAAAAKDVTEEAIRDAYAGLKTLIIRKFGDKPQVPASLQLVEAQPDSVPYQQTLEDTLEQIHAADDPDIVAQTQTLLALLQESGLGATYMARLQGSGAIAQGPGAVAAGKGGVAIGGDVQGSVIITGNENSSNVNSELENDRNQFFVVEDVERRFFRSQ